MWLQKSANLVMAWTDLRMHDTLSCVSSLQPENSCCYRCLAAVKSEYDVR